MIEIQITNQMKRSALAKAEEMGELKNSITKGAGNLAGFIGEEVANSILQGMIVNTKDYDIVTGLGNGDVHESGQLVTWDVKTKRCTSPPRPFYECSIAQFNTKQKCDRYIFVRIQYDDSDPVKAWILGWMDKEEYFQKARFLKKGEIDGSNGFKVKANCYNLEIKDLNDASELYPAARTL